MHDGDAIAEVADERHGVGDEEVGEAVLALEVAEEVDDLGSDGDVEGADGFVEDQELGAEGEGSGDVDALALASAELVRVAGEGGGVEADGGEEFEEAGLHAFGGLFVVDAEGLGEDLADAHTRVEGGVGVLEDDLHLAAEGADTAGGCGADVFAVEVDGAGGGLDEADEHAGYGAFAGAGFADEAEGFAAADGEGDVVDDAGGAAVAGVLLDEAVGLEQRCGFGRRRRRHRRMVASCFRMVVRTVFKECV